MLSCRHCSPAGLFPASLSASGRSGRVVLPTLGLASPFTPGPAKGIDANQASVTANFKHPMSSEEAVLDPFKAAHCFSYSGRTDFLNSRGVFSVYFLNARSNDPRLTKPTS